MNCCKGLEDLQRPSASFFGTRAGINDQPASHAARILILPAKVNLLFRGGQPGAFDVIGNDLASRSQRGWQLELNVMEPLIAVKLFTSFNNLTNVLPS
jgi:aspartate ammonia-lyase